MDPVPVPADRIQRPILYGALVVGALAAIVVTGWVFLSPSLLLHRQVAAATSQPVEPPPSSAPTERPVSGRVMDAESGAPLAGASVWVGPTEVRTDNEGRFTTEPLRPGAAFLVKVPGYELRRLTADRDEVTVALAPKVVRAAYLTYYGVADKGIRDRVLELVARTELNAVVIDVKCDRGLIPYRTEVPLALEAGAQGPVIIKDFDGLMASLKARNVYTIARIVTFKDHV